MKGIFIWIFKGKNILIRIWNIIFWGKNKKLLYSKPQIQGFSLAAKEAESEGAEKDFSADLLWISFCPWAAEEALRRRIRGPKPRPNAWAAGFSGFRARGTPGFRAGGRPTPPRARRARVFPAAVPPKPPFFRERPARRRLPRLRQPKAQKQDADMQLFKTQ
jgi:hypothetical protein